MAQLLEVQEREFKIIMITMLKALMEKVDNIQDQIGNFNRHGNYKNQMTGNKKQ